MKKILICFLYVFGLPITLVTLNVHTANSADDKPGALSDTSVEHDKNQSIAKVPSGANDDDDLNAFDLTQDDPASIHLAGLDIRVESQKLSVKLHRFSNEELCVSSVQV